MTGGLYYYRDRAGVEVDLVIDRPDGFVLVEGKAARTLHSDADGPMGQVARTLRQLRPTESGLVYGGSELQRRTDLTARPWSTLMDL